MGVYQVNQRFSKAYFGICGHPSLKLRSPPKPCSLDSNGPETFLLRFAYEPNATIILNLREKMKLVHLFQEIWRRLRDRILLIDFKIKQRRHLKKQKADDPNIYPLW